MNGVALSIVLSLAAPAQGRVEWVPSLASARARAADEDKMLFVSVVMPGERGSDVVIRHCEDDRLRGLSRLTINYRLELGRGEPSEDEKAVLAGLLGAGRPEAATLPQQLFLLPDGATVFSSAARQLTVGELEWMWVDAIRSHDESFAWQRSGGARMPVTLHYRGALESRVGTRRPPGADLAKQAIAELKKRGGGGPRGRGAVNLRMNEHYEVVLRSPESFATRFIEIQFRSAREAQVANFLQKIGDVSPMSWSDLLVEFLTHRSATLRASAARALDTMGDPSTARAVLGQLRAESESAVRGRLLRAAATLAPADKRVASYIEDALRDEDDAGVRMHAAVAAGCLDDRDRLRQLLGLALADVDASVRSAAAYSVARQRDADLLGDLNSAVGAEGDAEALHWLELAAAVVAEKRDLRAFGRLVNRVLDARG